ncbi:hypothetical protein ABGB18_17500 [Nonomuraea sp. B12E4]|uniref:hypothetical protein n=1 Tax=Nonomuraea sp. B12E4 TaxID=3153564 RepID=UPI00325EE77D
MTHDDERLLRRAIELAASARAAGDPPFGSLLATSEGTILVEERNTSITDSDITAHPELKRAGPVAPQEVRPCDRRSFRGRVYAFLLEDLPHGGGRDRDTEHGQFAVYPPISP